VEYKETWNYNASTVPPEWHGWLHHITDDLPDKVRAYLRSCANPAHTVGLVNYCRRRRSHVQNYVTCILYRTVS